MHKSTESRAAKIRAIVEANYEPGRQDRCKKWVYRNLVAKEFGISEPTFWRYLSAGKEKVPKVDPRQLKLF